MTVGHSEGATIFMFKGRAVSLSDIEVKSDRLRLSGLIDVVL